MIRFENVTVIRNGKTILKEIDWNVNKNEHWAILGLNGSGKTSLLNVICGYLYPTSGKVQVLGQEFGKTNIPELRKDIGFISSSLKGQLKNFDTVLSIVLSGKFASIGLYEAVEKKDVQEARRLMEQLGIEHLEDSAYGVLSEGEKQRVLIARALMAHPKILILDEPCNGLDVIAREEFLEFIEKLAQQEFCPTLIYVTHHVEEVLPCFSHTLLLKDGEVYAQGFSRELLKENTLSEFFGREVTVQEQQNRTWIAIK
ncbi:ABC transporter ATP-binding protein [Ureibacillus sp. FSL K6-8385]|uniref:ABC transporter ATP-binding protein n=1 Tax=Ureibacillus terrenus TaxID=118246 RepID=A0A540V649_9BACL|nr:ABC transporter ATP-binding protein [Ureibacillus terrenus]MED3660816.1 ABC transporter ATP-binding protein [Ureibacillus terrenus]MED3763004.1 ABC transporter ATP-binding protein [Ureibacillus terrenus]TQE92198.1 ABC transporter ATP-binding protein [Ureibacillus terrenus]